MNKLIFIIDNDMRLRAESNPMILTSTSWPGCTMSKGLATNISDSFTDMNQTILMNPNIYKCPKIRYVSYHNHPIAFRQTNLKIG
ncbi:MAG: hypothetical protein Ct9H300mP27_07140 [Chloroflexota bacterium]|nr:MAG: hypothetical protein Ct9H300mP27_07140 [Chloroflexota bacterium]